MELWIGALNLGFLYAFMTMGVFITLRVQDFADITVDGSFTTGAATASVLLLQGVNPLAAMLAAFGVGSAAGATTAVIHTRLKVGGLLSGILVMTGLYSVNLHIMGRSNIPLLNQTTFLTGIEGITPAALPLEIRIALAMGAVTLLFWLLASLFFKTDLGIAMRITGNNPTMAAASGINVDRMKIFSVALSNGLVGLSGAMVAQYQGFCDIGMGIGTIVVGFAAVIIGESVIRSRSIYARVLSVIVGTLIFRFMIAIALFVGMNPIDLKLLTAAFVLLTLVASKLVAERRAAGSATIGPLAGRRMLLGLGGAAVALLVVFASLRLHSTPQQPTAGARPWKIGIFQVTDNGLLNITRDSLLAELDRIGYKQGGNCTLMVENANGDLPTVNTILDKFVQQKVDLIVAISTPCTQAAITRVKETPVVFATVANPFTIGAGQSDAVHQSNVTGVYGWAPMDRLMELVRAILPGRLTIGALWDSSQVNSVFNVENLRKVVDASEGVMLLGATITSSAEVHDAAVSLVYKGIDAFVLPPDNVVYSAFDSVLKAARARSIPIFLSDVERLGDGALCALGYDYSSSGRQAARLVDRILKGEKPADIPFERYSTLTLGVNLKTARELGIAIPPEILSRATLVHGGDVKAQPAPVAGAVESRGASADAPKPARRLAVFSFSDNPALEESRRGLRDALEASGILKECGITVDERNAQSDFSMAQSIAQDIVRQQYDYVVTVSTIALQVMAKANSKIPHVFGTVTDPYRVGVARSAAEHAENITGVATFQPVRSTVRLMRELFPKAERIGLVWNFGEASSEACTLAARKAAEEFGFTLVEANATSGSEVLDAVRSVVGKGVDLFITSGDNTLMLAIESVAATLRKHKIPLFTNTPADIDHGSFLSLGADYYEVGKETARMAMRVIKGEVPAGIPIEEFVPEKVVVNAALAESYGIELPAALLERAARVVR